MFFFNFKISLLTLPPYLMLAMLFEAEEMLDLLLELVFFPLHSVFQQLEWVFRYEERVYILFYVFGSLP